MADTPADLMSTIKDILWKPGHELKYLDDGYARCSCGETFWSHEARSAGVAWGQHEREVTS